MRVYKYVIVPDEPTRMPRGAELLHVETQVDSSKNEQVCVWALVDPEAPKVMRRLRAHGTGHNLGPGATRKTFVGTAVFKTMALVFHVFDLGEEEIATGPEDN